MGSFIGRSNGIGDNRMRGRTEGTASSDVSAQKTDGSGEKLVIGVALMKKSTL